MGDASAITGVVSHGGSACSDHAVYARVDVARASFIEPYLEATAPSTAAAREPCLYAEQCDAGPCLQTEDEASLWFCSRACGSD